MKKLSWFVVVSLAAALPAFAAEDKPKSNFSASKKPSVSAATSVAAAPASSDAKRAEARKKIEEKKKELNGSEWKVALTSGAKADGEDTLTFQNGQMTSEMFADKGYPASNYTISVPEGADMATWETMKTNADGGVLFMRGEWKEDMMRGVISQQIEEGKTRDYNFASAGKVAVPPTTEKKEEAAQDAPKAEETPKDAPADEVAAFSPGTTDETAKR